VTNSTSVANRDGVECPLVDKLYNSNTHDMVQACFVRFYFFIFEMFIDWPL